MAITFVAQDKDAVALEALEILKQRKVQVVQVPRIPDEVPEEWVVLTGETPPRFPNGHLRIIKEEQKVFVRNHRERRARNPEGFEAAVVGMAREFGALPPIEPSKKRRYGRGGPFSRKVFTPGITGIYPE